MLSLVVFIFASYLLHVQSFESEEALKKYRSKWRRHTNATMVQVGANGGQEMQWALNIKHPHLNVIGVECLFRAYVKLVEMFENEPRATLVNACAGENTGLLTLNLADDSSSLIPSAVKGPAESLKAEREKKKEVVVLTVKMDDVLKNIKDIVFVQIDTQGYEVYVLKGLTNVLKTQKPVVFFEDSLDPKKEAKAFIMTLDYTCEQATPSDTICW